MGEQSHQSDPRVLNRRTLTRDHRRLADILRPGMAVLDVGCGAGAITAGIAARVGPSGHVVGLDRDESLLSMARAEHHGNLANLEFQAGDSLSLPFDGCFDVVTAARTLQWIAEPSRAVAEMKKAARRGGRVMALDYNHEDNSWEPAPPAEFARFYQAFLDWRAANGWDNRMADHLWGLFHAAGLTELEVYVDNETADRGDAAFPSATAIWPHVIETVGPRIVTAGFLTHPERLQAEECYRAYSQTSLQRQRLSMKTAVGIC